MKRPSFQFYPADWRNNANLRRCSPAARGVWLDVMCVLHDSDTYGLVQWPLADLANAANAPMKLVRELVEKSVLKGSDKALDVAFIYTPRSGRRDGEPVTLVPTQPGPVWFSSRMVKDEYVRTIRGESSRFGEADGESPKRSPKPPKGDGSSSSSSPSGNSVPNGTGGEPPKVELTPAETIFHYGVPMLTNSGVSDKDARSFLGGLRKGHGDDAVIAKLRECFKAKPLAPLEWLAAALPPKDIPKKTEWHETQSGIEAMGVKLGVGMWTQTEQFPLYKARVMAAHAKGAH